MVESHTKQQSPETVSETELREKRPKPTSLRARTWEREQWRIFPEVGDDVVKRDK